MAESKKRKKKPIPEGVAVTLPVLQGNSFRLHTGIASCEVGGKVLQISGGFGLGHTELYVSVDGKRQLQVDARPLLDALITRALSHD